MNKKHILIVCVAIIFILIVFLGNFVFAKYTNFKTAVMKRYPDTDEDYWVHVEPETTIEDFIYQVADYSGDISSPGAKYAETIESKNGVVKCKFDEVKNVLEGDSSQLICTGDIVTVKMVTPSQGSDGVVGKYTILVYGDIDGDGKYTYKDILKVSNYLNGEEDTEGVVFHGTEYTALTDEQIWMIAHICELENDGADGVAFQCCFLANLFELYTLKYGDSKYGTGTEGLIAYITDTSRAQYILQVYKGHFAYGCSDNSITDEELEVVRDILVNGNRIIPQYVNEHDWIYDISSATNNGVSFSPTDRSQYTQDVTIVKNIYSSTWTFYAFCKEGGDPYGYTDWAYELVMNSGSMDD